MSGLPEPWCRVCCTQHSAHSDGPGNLLATGEERHGWRLTVKVPGGGDTINFVGTTPQEVERRAIAFVRDHCDQRGVREWTPAAEATPARVEAEAARGEPGRPGKSPAPRITRFLPTRFGITGPTEQARPGNLSTTGLFVITDHSIEAGRSIRMLLEVEEGMASGREGRGAGPGGLRGWGSNSRRRRKPTCGTSADCSDPTPTW